MPFLPPNHVKALKATSDCNILRKCVHISYAFSLCHAAADRAMALQLLVKKIHYDTTVIPADRNKNLQTIFDKYHTIKN